MDNGIWGGGGFLPIALGAFFVALIVLLVLRRRNAGRVGVVESKQKPIEVDSTPAVSRVQPAPAQPLPETSVSAKNSIEVAEADPLAEAAVYLEFGYLDRAAQCLRDHVDGAGRGSREILHKLLQIYLRLESIDDYAEILDRLSAAGDPPEFIQTALLSGLEVDQSNLQLRVLAETSLGLGPAQINKLLGIEDSQAFDEDAGEVSAQASPRSGIAALDRSVDTSEHRAKVIPFPTVDQSKPRIVAPLIAGSRQLQSALSNDERSMLRVFTHPAHEARMRRTEARMHRESGDLDAAVTSFRSAIAARPQALVNFVDLLLIFHRRREVEEYAVTLWHLYTVLNGAGRALRERFLGMGFVLGHHPAFEALAQATDKHHLDKIGREFKFVSEETASRKLCLVEAVLDESSDVAMDEGDVLREASGYIEFGQVDEAIALLESAVINAPADEQLYPLLFDLYDRMDELDRLLALVSEIKQGGHQLPEEIVPMMLTLQQRLEQRQRSARAR